ncbi:MAG TPA: crotonase/enoyl-CoA hydratase family protein [Tenacibaculum sp.]|nr:crotonase/enoyl-CoA hydratase family protein [Tenacibaculum sp.]
MDKLTQYKEDSNYAIITLNNGKVNAISHQVIDELNTALDRAESNKKVVILTGKSGVFSGGYDLKSMMTSPESALELVTRGSQLALKMLRFPLPIIAACSGHAIAKGAFLLLSTDYRLGIDGQFKVGLNEVMIGMTMHNAGIEIAKGRLSPVFLERSVNNAEIYTPKEAILAGFLDKVVPSDDLLLPAATKIAEMFGQLNLKAHAETKLKVRDEYLKRIEEAIQKDLKEGLIPPSK